MIALSGTGLVLSPESTTKEHLSGRIIPQSGSNLDTIGKLFSGFLAGDNQTLSVVGDSVQPSGSNGAVSWLSTAFKTLTLSVILPGQKSSFYKVSCRHMSWLFLTHHSCSVSADQHSHDAQFEQSHDFGAVLQRKRSAEGSNQTFAFQMLWKEAFEMVV